MSKHIGNIKWTFIGKSFEVFYKTFIFLIVIKLIDQTQYGKFAYCFSFTALLALFVDFGCIPATANIISTKQYPIRYVLKNSIVLLSLSFLVICSIMLVLNHINKNILECSYWAFILLLLNQITVKYFSKISESLNKNKDFWAITTKLSFLPWTICLILSYFFKTAEAAIWGYIIGYVPISLFNLKNFLTYLKVYDGEEQQEGKISPSLDKESKKAFYKRYINTSLLLVLSTSGYYIFTESSVVMLKYFSGLSQVGVYSAAVKIVNIFSIIPAVLASSTVISFIESKNKFAFLNNIMNFIFYLSIPVILFIGMYSDRIFLLVFGKNYANSATLFVIFIPFMICKLYTGSTSLILDYSGHYKQRAFAVLTASLINLGLGFLIIPKYTIWGAAISTILAYLPLTIYYFWSTKNIYFKNQSVASLLLPLPRSFIGALLFLGAVLFLLKNYLTIPNIYVLCLASVVFLLFEYRYVFRTIMDHDLIKNRK